MSSPTYSPKDPSARSRTTVAVAAVVALGAGLLAAVQAPSVAAPVASASKAAASASKPQTPPTEGNVTGQVVGPKGAPIKNALVMGLRFSDFGAPIDVTDEARVLARTNATGHFTLRQFKERYLIRICSEAPGSDGECAFDPADKRFTPSYVGPDGRTDSWLQQTRLFEPKKSGRNIGKIAVGPTAVLLGRYNGGAFQQVYLLRADNSVADRAFTDEQGDYRFEVAAGMYRVEVDRHEGLRTGSTVPGFRSDLLALRAGRKLELSFRTRHAATVRGQVTSDGDPVGDQFLAILNNKGEFAAGVVTDGQGRYVVSSLKPGKYTIRTSTNFNDHVPVVKPVTLTGKQTRTVNIALSDGAVVRFSTDDTIVPGGDGVIDAELRNQAGRVVKAYQGNPADEESGQVRWRGLAAGDYDLYVRRMSDPFSNQVQTQYPWASREVTVTGTQNENLGEIDLDQPTLNLTGNIPKGSQVKITPVPQDPWLREAHTNGDQATSMAIVWTEKAKGDGTYLSRGLVPGKYTVLVTTGYQNRRDPTTVGANVATREHTVVVTPGDLTANFPAPKGAKVKGRMRYEKSHRPLIAPVGYQVFDGGDESWLFPTVSGPQKFDRPFTVLRLHQGKAVGRLLEEEGLFAMNPDIVIPDTLTMSSPLAETATPYWFTSKSRTLRLKKGKVLDLGFVNVVLRGRAPETKPAGGNGNGNGNSAPDPDA